MFIPHCAEWGWEAPAGLAEPVAAFGVGFAQG